MGDDLITNRKAHRDYEILETYEAGIVLRGHTGPNGQPAYIFLTTFTDRTYLA